MPRKLFLLLAVLILRVRKVMGRTRLLAMSRRRWRGRCDSSGTECRRGERLKQCRHGSGDHLGPLAAAGGSCRGSGAETGQERRECRKELQLQHKRVEPAVILVLDVIADPPAERVHPLHHPHGGEPERKERSIGKEHVPRHGQVREHIAQIERHAPVGAQHHHGQVARIQRAGSDANLPQFAPR
jgi:hypothetical protein